MTHCLMQTVELWLPVVLLYTVYLAVNQTTIPLINCVPGYSYMHTLSIYLSRTLQHSASCELCPYQFRAFATGQNCYTVVLYAELFLFG